ncbi:MAG: acyltransferase family protein [Puniceicoccales bacterium]
MLKAISIFGVVYIHASGIWARDSLFRHFWVDVFRFGVPCFIIVWAYFFEIGYAKRAGRDKLKYQAGKTFHIFIVFLTWSLLYFALRADFSELTLRRLIVWHFFGTGWSGQYFFIILFQLVVLYPILRWAYQHRWIRNIVLLVILIVYILSSYFSGALGEATTKLGDRPCIYWIPYVFLGIALTSRPLFQAPWALVLTVLLIPGEFALLEHLSLHHTPYVTPVVILSSVLFCLPFFSHRLTPPDWMRQSIEYIGANTMTIFVANPLIIILITRLPLPQPQNELSGALLAIYSLTSTIIVFCACLGIAEIINRTKLKGILN